MGFYSDVIFPRLYDWLIDTPHWARYRQEQLATVDGDILEIGVGTGLNLPHYPAQVRKITTVEPSPGMNRRLPRQIAATGIEVDHRILGGEKIPFDGETFDCVLIMEFLEHVEQDIDVLTRVRPGTTVLATVPNFAHEGHVHHFNSVAEVESRYSSVLSQLNVVAVLENEAGKTYYVLQGTR